MHVPCDEHEECDDEHEERQDDHEVRGHQVARLLLLLTEDLCQVDCSGYRVGLNGALRFERVLLDSETGHLRVRTFVDEMFETFGDLGEPTDVGQYLLDLGTAVASALGDDVVSVSLVHVAWMTKAQYVFYMSGNKLL